MPISPVPCCRFCRMTTSSGCTTTSSFRRVSRCGSSAPAPVSASSCTFPFARHRIGFFLHIPFVPPEILDALPCGVALLKSLCAYDVIGFHTDDHRNAFLACVRAFLHVTPDDDGSFVYDGRRVRTLSDPIGIDAEEFAAIAARSS